MVWRLKSFRKVTEPAEISRPSLRVLESERMVLVAANAALVKADLGGRDQLESMLESIVPDNWPPELYDREAMEHALRMLKDSSITGWSFWYLIERGKPEPSVLGICGFKGRPDSAGSAEIGYSIVSQFRNQGFATEAVDRLVRWAFSHQAVIEVTAETLPYLNSSIRVMKKNGFQFVGAGSELGVVRYAVQRPDRR